MKNTIFMIVSTIILLLMIVNAYMQTMAGEEQHAAMWLSIGALWVMIVWRENK